MLYLQNVDARRQRRGIDCRVEAALAFLTFYGRSGRVEDRKAGLALFVRGGVVHAERLPCGARAEREAFACIVVCCIEYRRGKRAEVLFYEGGFYLQARGVIEEIDLIRRTIRIGEGVLSFEDIYYIRTADANDLTV